MPPKVAELPSSTLTLTPEERESQYVHVVYDQIASHFSQTRYKPWPIISSFLKSIAPGSIGLDSGTGNGKYLPLDQGGKIMMIGLDRSRKLLEIAKDARSEASEAGRREVICGDALEQPWRLGIFDFAISIATIHHLSTPQRRQQAVETLLQCLDSQHGRAMIYVWATEQDPLSKRTLPATLSNDQAIQTQHPATSKVIQDVLVPWVKPIQPSQPKSCEPGSQPHSSLPPAAQQDLPAQTVFQRYYHFFEKDELRKLVYAAATNVGLHIGKADQIAKTSSPGKGSTKGVEVVAEGYERSNYYVELRLWEQ